MKALELLAVASVKMFSPGVFSLLVYAALGGTALGLLTLLTLILKDHRKRKIW